MRADVPTTSKEAMSDHEDPTPDEAVSARANAKEKLGTIQRKQRRQGRRGAVIASVVAVLLIVGIGGGAVYFTNKDDDTTAAGGADYGKVKTYKLDDGPNGKDREHKTSGFKYEQEPPVGGAHHAAWANCGIYDKKIKTEHAVHSLEHGTVWITYKSSVPDSQVKTLEGKVKKQGEYMMMSKDDDQQAPITLTAWGKQLQVKSADDPTIDDFIKKYWKGPQTPEPGAACSGAYDPNTGKIAGGM